MTTLSIQPPFPILTDADGQPLEDGYIWIGAANLPPIGNPIAVYWDAALTIPAALPIRTRGGYPANAGTPARLYVGSDYSILVQNKNGSTLYSALDGASDRFSAAQISFLQAGAGAVARTVQSKLRETVSVKDFGAVGDGVADDSAAIQIAINNLVSGQTLTFDGNHKITSPLLITNKSRIRLTGKGRVFFSGAASGDYIFQLVGTIDDLEIDGLTLEGDGNSSYTQGAIGCNSGQTISNTRFHDLNISEINVGISHNADLSGSWTNGLCYNNYLKNILGTVPGAGYGIQMSKAYNLQVFNNTIDNASRHAIYQARGQNVNVLIQGNTILNHRKDVFDGSPRMAIACSRSSDVTIANNKFLDCYDGQINIDQDTTSSASCSNILVIGNTFTNRKNNTPAIWIGEQLVPTTATVFKISVLNNTFDEDQSVPSGLGSSIYILHGNIINVEGNRFRRFNVTTVLTQCIELGDTSYITSDSHISDIVVRNNFATADNTVAGSRFAYIVDQLCTGNSMYLVKDNVCQGWASEYYFEATPTNVNSKLKFTTTIVHTWSVPPNTVASGAFTVTGCKPTSSVTVRPDSAAIVSPMIAIGGYAKTTGVNAVEIYAVNANATTTSTQTDLSHLVHVEDF